MQGDQGAPYEPNGNTTKKNARTIFDLEDAKAIRTLNILQQNRKKASLSTT